MKNSIKPHRYGDKFLRYSLFPLAILLSIFLTSFQPPPSLVELFSFGHFHDAKGISVDPIGAIYVADTGDDLLMRFNPSGDSTGEVGGYGSGGVLYCFSFRGIFSSERNQSSAGNKMGFNAR